jgi:hypothetical protein
MLRPLIYPSNHASRGQKQYSPVSETLPATVHQNTPMDLIVSAATLLLLLLIIPVILATTSLSLYLSVLGCGALAVLGYLWLIDKLAPSESQSRRQAAIGLLQVYPDTGNSIPQPADGDTRTAYVELLIALSAG